MTRLTLVFGLLTLCPASFTLTASAQTAVEVGEDEASTDDALADRADAEPDEERAFDGEGLEEEPESEDPGRAPPPGRGVIWGVIRDTAFNEPLIEASVQIVGGKALAITDEEGRFRLEVPPGTYSVRVAYELHKSERVDRVVVAAGQVNRVDVQLAPDEGATEEFEIVEEADKSSLEGILLARRRATIVGDSVGRSEISKTTDRNAAQAAQRVVGATVEGGRFVYVRGLGERYTNALLNGVPLPSPEPDRAAVPLDLFPTGVLNSLTIAKTFTPDAPGDFAGGSVRIETREIPNELLFQVSARGGYNTNSTFRERLSARGGDLDWLGIDDGTRALPATFPNRNIGSLEDDAAAAAGLSLNSYMSAQRSGTPPDHSIGVVAGNGWDLGENRKLGLIGSVSYGRGYTVRRDEILRLFRGDASDPRGFTPIRDYRVTTGVESVNWGGMASATYRFSPHHRLGLLGLRSTLADDRTQYITGSHVGREQDIHATGLRFVTRALNLGLLNGEHSFPSLGNAELDWNLVLSSALRDEPDRRDVVWGRALGSSDSYRFTQATESGRHFFADQVERQYGGGIDWTQPIGVDDSKLKLGGLVSLRDRTFTSRTLRFEVPRGVARPQCPPGQLDTCNDALFVPENIGTTLVLTENTLPQDAYDATLNVYAAYVMADLALADDVRVVVGERVEHTLQTIEPYDQFGTLEPPEGARISRTDLLPALSATWSPTKKTKLRVSVTRTLARPQLRELAPFAFVDYFGGRVTSGSKDLEVTRITNVDTRIEHFPTVKDVLAFSLFFKDFRDPIEQVILAAGDEGSLTYRNAAGAKLIGVELDARASLGFAAPVLENFGAVANLTLAHSRIELPSGGTVLLTNASRPLVNQAPWVLNLALDYSHEAFSGRVLYNVVGPRIAQVGSAGLEDVYQHPRGLLDLTVQRKFGQGLSLKLEARNVLNSEVLQTQGCGGNGLFGSTWHLSCSNGDDEAVSKYSEGVSFALSAGYDF